MIEELTQEYLNRILSYDDETGVLTWRVHKGPKVYPGKVAGSLDKDGYVRLKVDYKTRKAHRIIWKMKTGEWPVEIDHINRVKSDNRWVNLRSTNRSGNMRNTSLGKNSTSGHKGVSWCKRENKWRAWIFVDGKIKSLKYHEKIEDAIKIREEAEKEFYT